MAIERIKGILWCNVSGGQSYEIPSINEHN